MTLLYGCDVSTFQAPGLVDWTKKDFGIVRATYGARLDGKCVEHAKRIRGASKPVGLYHFHLPHVSAKDQIDAFARQAEAVKLGPGDILPCLDIEAYPDRFKGQIPTHYAGVDKTWADEDTDALMEIVEQWDKDFGGFIPYLTQADWHLLGKPSWILKRPLWVAHYPKRFSTSPLKAPATPGSAPWRMWQWLIGPLDKQLQDHKDPRAVDQNIATAPLPLIASPDVKPEPEVVPEPYEAERAIPYVLLSDDDWEEMRVARDEAIHSRTEEDDA